MRLNICSKIRATWQVPIFDTKLWLGRTRRWCIVIPVINEGERIMKLLARMTASNIHNIADIIIVDAGSSDSSLELNYLIRHSVKGLLVKKDSGKLSAQLRCAYAFILDHGYDGVITIDGNNKDNPAAIPDFIDALKQGYDFIQASRFIREGVAKNTPKIRYIAIRFIHAPLLSLFSGFKWTDTTQGFRAYSKRILIDQKVAPFREVFNSYELLAYMSYRIPRLGYRCIELPTAREYPKGEIPTKISGLKGNLNLIYILIKTCIGKYNP
jgi:glycosyltransferase involved in cell wall biosynthesis